MEIIKVDSKQLKAVTLFLIDKEVIFHPIISPNGYPDFTGRFGRKNILIIDRNIMTKIVEFCRSGILKDSYIRKVIGALLFWAAFNNVNITGGLALNEYAIVKGINSDASFENNVFLKLFDQYSPKLWLDVFEEKILNIPPIKLDAIQDYSFEVDNDHYNMHLSETIHLASLHLNSTLTPTEKIIDFLSWVDQNLLFCVYSVTYACMLFSQKVKQLKISLSDTYETVLKKCSNQAWDLTYLSFWSTLYWEESESTTNHLFATMDTDLKKIFINAHDTSNNLFYRFFGECDGNRIQAHYQSIINNRNTPVMTQKTIAKVLNTEKNHLSILLTNR